MVDAPSPLRRSARGATIHAAAGVAQLVEHQLPKLRVVGSSPIARSKFHAAFRCPGKRLRISRGPILAKTHLFTRAARRD